jgi:phage N-6-adenine-methyltransferase
VLDACRGEPHQGDFLLKNVTEKSAKKRPRGRPRLQKNRVLTNAEMCRRYRQRRKRSVHFSSESDLYTTPQETFDELNAEFGFTVDVCALPENTKCARYFTPEQDGLQQDWRGEVVWCNPPYGRTIAAWVQKAYEASKAGATVVCLLPARLGPRWWRTYVQPYAQWYVLEKRQNFSGKGRAPFDSVVAIFRPPVLP